MNSIRFRMTPTERRIGRILRAPDHTAGTESAGGQNNAPGNSGADGVGTQDSNNTGQSFDPATFWSSPAGGESGAPSGGSAASATQSAGTQAPAEQGAQVGQRLAQQLSTLSFAPVFNNDVATQIADGDLTGINEAMVQFGRDSARHAVQMSAELIQVYGQHLMTRVQEMVEEALGGRDNEAALMAEFPQVARDPGLKPTVSAIFQQSMKHTNNNREAAVAMTREMLKFVGTGVSKQLGLNDAPGNAQDNLGSGAASLVEELLAR